MRKKRKKRDGNAGVDQKKRGGGLHDQKLNSPSWGGAPKKGKIMRGTT